MEIELVPEHVHRALIYLELLAKQGKSPNKRRLDTFAVMRTPRLARRQHFLTAVEIGVQNMLTTPVPPDSVTDYLTAMDWVTVTDEPDHDVAITALGQAVLRGLDARLAEEPDEPEVADVVLSPDEPLTWMYLTRTLGIAGEGMLVDAYFKADFLPWILDSTSLKRILVSSRHPRATQDLADLAVTLGVLPGAADKLEIRSTKNPELHDRCLIHADKTVRLLGASITGVGKNLTAVIAPHETIQRAYGELYERLWREAAPLTPVPRREVRRPLRS